MERVDADLVPFAQNNPSGYRFAFGTDTATDDINANYNDNIKKGWGTTPNEFPEVEDFNAFAYTSGYLTAYLYQMGIAEWNNKQKYKKYSRVIGGDGKIYKAKEGTDLAPNVNNNPTTDTTNWEDVLSNYVATTGNQTIAGVKTFTSSPIVPTPTTGFQAATKQYVDTKALNINTLPDKPTPDDTDNLAIQEVGGDLKKVSFQNLTKLSPNDSRVKTALNASGEAPIYACRAWVNFNGNGAITIRASGNTSSITDNGVGDYIVNFATAMPNANYSVANNGGSRPDNTRAQTMFIRENFTPTLNSVGIGSCLAASTASPAISSDPEFASVLIFI